MKRGLKLFGRLDRYVGSLFLSSYATAFLIVVGLFLIMDLAGKLDDYLVPWKDGTRVPTSWIVRYYALSIPFLYLQVAPFVTLVAGLFTVSKLLKHNETIAALAAGVSAHRLLMPVFLGAGLAAAGMFWMRESLVENLGPKLDHLRFVLEEQSTDQVYFGVWVRDKSGSLVRLSEFRPRTGSPAVAEVRGLESVLVSVNRIATITAPRAVFRERGGGRSGWWLSNGRTQEVRGEQRTRPVEWLDGFEFTPKLAMSYVRARANPLDLSFSEARELASRSPDDTRFQVMLQYHLTFPLANLILLLVGWPILLRHDRGRGAEGLAKGCLLCVFYFAADFVLRNQGLGGRMDPVLAAWLPILFFGSLGLALYETMRT